MLVLCTAALVAYRTRRLSALACFALAAAPWIAAHHALNYYVGGSLLPANMNVEFLQWPGSPFNAENITGAVKSKSAGKFLLYPPAMLFGKHGFFNHNLPLMLSLAGLFLLMRRRLYEKPELIFGAGFFCRRVAALCVNFKQLFWVLLLHSVVRAVAGRRLVRVGGLA